MSPVRDCSVLFSPSLMSLGSSRASSPFDLTPRAARITSMNSSMVPSNIILSHKNSSPQGDVGSVKLIEMDMSIRTNIGKMGCQPPAQLHSVQDEVYIAPKDPTPHIGWTPHHNLQRLTLYNPILDAELTKAFMTHPNLQQVIIVRPDFDEYFLGETLKHIQTWRELVLVGHEALSANRCAVAIRDAAASLDRCCKLVYVRYDWPEASVGWDSDIIDDIQLFVRSRLEDGVLFEGETMNSEKTKGDVE
ncbi:hypothetical protein FIBSPDRAFT_930117 [Athelia psychrophila]|uniref:Uncharacterized protein n=1 Tax=Athelia psychrophila TaxID=1759441 RepID=A0A166MNU4_9AGAM|nr:hypothetical protein FIBSPDRAFT_930117 [Fibularhizoctonia sp. CBS 109695]